MTVSTKTARAPTHAAHKIETLSPLEQGVLWEMEDHFWTSGADNALTTTATNAIMIFGTVKGKWLETGRAVS